MYMTLVKDWMTPNPVTVSADTPIQDAYQIMLDQNVRYLPVLDAHGNPVSVVTRSQLRHEQMRTIATSARSDLQTLQGKTEYVGDMNFPPLLTLDGDALMIGAIELMLSHQCCAILVVDQNTLVGIITESDIYRLLNSNQHNAVHHE